MNTDKNLQYAKNYSYPLVEQNQSNFAPLNHHKFVSDQQYATKRRISNYQEPIQNGQPMQNGHVPYFQGLPQYSDPYPQQYPQQYQNQYENQYPQQYNYQQNIIPNHQHVIIPNLLKLQGQSTNILNQELVICDRKFKFSPLISKQNREIVVPNPTSKNQAIMDAQTLPCRRCGLIEVGPLTYESGKATYCWGTALLLLTGIFCFMPCLGSKCKDVHVRCRACGHTKAIVPAKCCQC